MSEKIQIDYDFLIEYFNTELNVVGSTTSTTLRTVTTHNDGNSKYVKKYGTDYAIGEISNAVIDTPRSILGRSWKYEFINENGTVLGTAFDTDGASSFVAGTDEASERIYIKLTRIVNQAFMLAGDTITITTDVDTPLVISFPFEIIEGGVLTFLWSLSSSGSTYYMTDVDDNSMKYGGYKHTPDGTQKYPYFDIQSGIDAAQVAGWDIVTVLDSEKYETAYNETYFDLDISGLVLQSILGQKPEMVRGVGARDSRRPFEENSSNADTLYVSTTTGDDGTGDGRFQYPYATIQHAIDNPDGRAIIKISDSGVYNEAISGLNGLTVEPDWGYVPTIIAPNTEGTTITSTGAMFLGGFIVKGNGSQNPIATEITGPNNETADMTIEDFSGGVGIMQVIGNVRNCISRNHQSVGASGFRPTSSASFLNCVTYNCYYGLYASSSLTVGLNNCLFFDNVYGVLSDTSAVNTYYCVYYNNSYGFYYDVTVANTIIENNIFENNSIYGAFSERALTITYNNFYDNGTNYNANITSNNEILVDPLLCLPIDDKFGIQPNSPCYRAGSDGDDIGLRTRIAEINESNIEINGFIIDGIDWYSTGVFILDIADHTGFISKWCTYKNHIGIGLDLYDDDADLDAQILNCNFNNNGSGLGLQQGGNTIQECLFFKNAAQNLYLNYTAQTINHCVMYGGQHGIYLGGNITNIVIKNSTTHGNSLYGIYSDQLISSITYCDVSDGVNANVDISSVTNINVNPLFINIDTGDEDFNIKTKETNILDSNGDVSGQYQTNSGCKDSSDGVLYDDIGCYGVDRGIEELAWKKYVLNTNPTNLDDQNMPKGAVENEDSLGSYSSWAKAHKNIFPLVWAENQYSTEIQRKKIKYFNSLRPSRELGKTKMTTRMRFKRLPLTYIESGTNGVLSGTILTDSAKDLVENEVKGFYAGLIFDSQTNYVIDAAGKTATSSGAGWTIDEHIGRSFKYNGYSYYVKSNTSEVLTLSDPYATLEDATAQSLSIEKYFEIKSNSETAYTLLDPDSELVDGTYDYYIDFAITRAVVQEFNSTQPLYNPSGVSTGYLLTLETI